MAFSSEDSLKLASLHLKMRISSTMLLEQMRLEQMLLEQMALSTYQRKGCADTRIFYLFC